MLRFNSFLILMSLIGLTATSAMAKSDTLQSIGTKYQNSALIEMHSERVVKSELLGKETKYDGVIYIAKGKFRWDNETPEKSLLVYDGSTIWSVQFPPKEFGGSIQVAKGKPEKSNKSHFLILSLFGKEISKNYKITKETKEGSDLLLSIEPVKGELAVKELQLLVTKSEKIIKKLTYTDDIGNLTTMNFSNVKFKSKKKDSLFKYQPPKGAQVTNL